MPRAALALLLAGPALLHAREPPPGATPWRQGIEYRIDARLDEDADLLEGRARVRYRMTLPTRCTPSGSTST